LRVVDGKLCGVGFEAEDGIRDIGVTGVQTCALPILVYEELWPWANRARSMSIAVSVSWLAVFQSIEIRRS